MTTVPSSPPTPARRKSPDDRRAELVVAAAAIAVDEGLDRVTAKRVGAAVGVFPGLVNHYFRSADELVAAAFGHAAGVEREEVFGDAEAAGGPVDQLRRLLAGWLEPARDAVSLLWLDAWQASRRRPALLEEVARQMTADLDRLVPLLHAGVAAGAFRTSDPGATAMRIMALVDGLSVQAAIRATFDYATVGDMVLRSAERELGLREGALT